MTQKITINENLDVYVDPDRIEGMDSIKVTAGTRVTFKGRSIAYITPKMDCPLSTLAYIVGITPLKDRISYWLWYKWV